MVKRVVSVIRSDWWVGTSPFLIARRLRPNGLRLSCGRNVYGRKELERQTKRLTKAPPLRLDVEWRGDTVFQRQQLVHSCIRKCEVAEAIRAGTVLEVELQLKDIGSACVSGTYATLSVPKE